MFVAIFDFESINLKSGALNVIYILVGIYFSSVPAIALGSHIQQYIGRLVSHQQEAL